MTFTIPHRLRPRNFTLAVYIGRRFLGIFLADLLVFGLIYALVDSLNQVDAFLKHADDFFSLIGIAARYYYYELPGLFCRFLGPVITMASAMFAVTLTARANEFVPILATGTSLRRALMPILLISAAIAAGSLWVQEVWIQSHRAEIRRARTFGRHYGEIQHAYFVDSEHEIYVAARLYFPGEARATGVFIRARDGDRETVYTAAEARWDDARRLWVLRDGEIQRYNPEGLLEPPPAPGPAAPDPPAPPIGEARQGEESGVETEPPRLTTAFDELDFALSSMIPQDLEGSESQDQFLSIRQLRRKAEVAPDPHRWLIEYYSRIAEPLNHIVLLLLGLPMIFLKNTRNVFLSALLAVGVATVYFICQALFVYLGNRQILDPAAAAWLAPILFTALGTTLFVTMRT